MSAEPNGSQGAVPARERRAFVVVTSQRAGSTLLVRSLDSSPVIFCAGEIFHTGPKILHPECQFPHTIFGSQSLTRLIDAFASRTRVRRHLRKFYASAGVNAVAVGFKLMVSQIRARPVIMQSLVAQRVNFIYLIRNDSFATALSYYRAQVSGVFHSNRAGAAALQVPIVADEARFLRELDGCRSDKEQLFRLQAAYGGRLLSYEDMIANWDAFIAMVGVELGIQGLRVQKALSKLQEGVDSVRIANEDELRERFGGDVTIGTRETFAK